MNFDLYKQVLDNLPDGVTIQDKDFNVIYQNHAMRKAFGDCIGGKCYANYEKRDEICEECGVLKAFRNNQPVMVLRTGFEQDGSSSYWENACCPLHNESGEIIAGVEICRNITDRVTLEEEVKERNTDLGQLNKQLKRQTVELEMALAELKATQSQLLEVSRQAGMAEVAVGILHNIGNVLNSVNVSASSLIEKLDGSQISNLVKVIALFRKHDVDIGSFLEDDVQGRRCLEYLERLGSCLCGERDAMREEIRGLLRNIDHIKEIVSMQQDYARTSGVQETVSVEELVEDSLRLNEEGLKRHQVPIDRNYDALGPITIQKHKVLQILINLISNAKYAMDGIASEKRRMGIRVESGPEESIRIAISDTGIGIPEENLNRIFAYGFTTRENGHGFGLHSSALAARELGGGLKAYSAGIGKGATFVLELPNTAKEKFHE